MGSSSDWLARSFALVLPLWTEHALAALPADGKAAPDAPNGEALGSSAPATASAGGGENGANEASIHDAAPHDVDMGANIDAAAVEVGVIGPRTPLIDEALLRIQAELRAVGFGVRLEESPADAEGDGARSASSSVGTIVLVHSGESVQILAQAYAEAPLTQQVDLTRPSITAEVVAVRAVEAMRAALLQSLRNRAPAPQSVPDPVRVFTQWTTAPAPEPAPPPPAPPSSPPASPPEPRPTSSPWLLSAGPLLVAPAFSVVTGGAEVQLQRSFGPAFAGLVVDGSIVPATWQTKYGSIEANQRSLLGTVGLDLACPSHFICQLGASFGARWTSFVALPEDESLPVETAQHESLLVEGDVLGGYFFDDHAGVIGRARVGALLDAPNMTAAHAESIAWGRPTWGLSLCAALRF